MPEASKKLKIMGFFMQFLNASLGSLRCILERETTLVLESLY